MRMSIINKELVSQRALSISPKRISKKIEEICGSCDPVKLNLNLIEIINSKCIY